MKKHYILKVALMSCMIAASGLAFGLNLTELTPDEAAKKSFSGNLCNKKFYGFIKFPHQVGKGKWKGSEGTPAKVDKLVADTTEACKASEKKIIAALNAMKADWFTKCNAQKCQPYSHAHSSDFSSPHAAGQTNCAYGEVTVTNTNNEAMSCNYPVEVGGVVPQKMNDKDKERCHEGEGDSEAKGYGSATVSIPASHTNPKFYMSLSCYGAANSFGKLDEYKSPDEPDPDDKPKEDPKSKDGK